MTKKSVTCFTFSALFSFFLVTWILYLSVPVYADASPLALAVETSWLSGRVAGNDTEQITVRYDSVTLHEDMLQEYPYLQQALDEMNGTELSRAQGYLDWYLELFQTFIGDVANVTDFVSCSCYHTALIKRADSSVTSILYQTEAYAGGAHPNTFHTAYNYRSSDGSMLSLGDVFPDTDQLREALYGQLALCYPSLDLSPLDDLDLDEFIWVLDTDGLTIYLGEYVIGSLYDGFQTAHFSYAEYGSFFADWVTDPVPYTGTELGNYEPTWRDLDNSGVPEVINVGFNTGEGTLTEESRQLSIYYSGQQEYISLPPCQDLFTTLLQYEGSTYLYIEASQDLDLAWYGTYRLEPQGEGAIIYIGTDLPVGAELYTSHVMIQYPLDLYGDGQGYNADDLYDYSQGYDNIYSDSNGEYDASLPVWNIPDLDTRPPFYGVWISASKDVDASWELADLIQADGVLGWVFYSPEWSNLNPEPWYLVTAGVYYTYEDALVGLARIQAAGYTDAYIKYSGDPVF